MFSLTRTLVMSPKYRLRKVRQRLLVVVVTGTFLLYYLQCRDRTTAAVTLITSSEDLPLFFRDVTANQEEYNIFQLETHTKNADIVPRIICSLESFCKNNPSATVWMLFIDTQSVPDLKLQLYLTLAKAYPNLRLARFNMEMLLADTPLANTLSKERYVNSQYLIYDLSDMGRVALLYKVGGFYSDFDVINLRDITSFTNFFIYESDDFLNNGIFHMEAGHPILNLLMEAMNSPEVDGDKTKLVAMSAAASAQDGRPAMCRGVSKLHKSAFSPLPWDEAEAFFKADSEQNFKKILMESLGVHLYHDVTHEFSIESESIYDLTAFTFCPLVHAAAYRNGTPL